MKKNIFIIAIVILAVSCTTHIHTVGSGPKSGESVTQRQWYAAYGLATLNNVDTQEMAAGSNGYEIKTQTTFIDGLISGVTGMFTVSCRTVTVTK